MNLRAMIIHPDDNVANLVGPGTRNAEVECVTEGSKDVRVIRLRESIPPNHKFAATDIKTGEPITKYGLNIGRASRDIRQGEHVHVHNVESNRGRGDLAESS